VIINEFGEVGLDHVLIESGDENTVLMESGCLCCTIRGDLRETLRDLRLRRQSGAIIPFDRVVVETTGLADPAPIIHTLMTDSYIAQNYRLDGIVACVDVVNAMGQMDLQPEAIKQAAVADRILLTKTDLLDNLVDGKIILQQVETRLCQINPAADMFHVVNGQVDGDNLFEAGLYNPAKKSPDVARWLKEEAYQEGHGHHHGHSHDTNRHDDHIRSFCISYAPPIQWDHFVEWADALISTNGENLLRLKGILYVKDAKGPIAVHAVQHIFHAPAMLESWPDDMEGDKRCSKIILITRDINAEAVEKMFMAFMDMG
jgi:G3E family GTPase